MTATTATTSPASITSAISSIQGLLTGLGANAGTATGGGATTAATGAAGTAAAGTAAAGTAAAAADPNFTASQTNLVTPPTTNLNVSTLSTTITSVAKLVSDRQTFLGKVSAAIAADAMKNGTPNQEAVVQLNMMTTSLQIINDMNKNLTDALKNTVQAWAQPGQ